MKKKQGNITVLHDPLNLATFWSTRWTLRTHSLQLRKPAFRQLLGSECAEGSEPDLIDAMCHLEVFSTNLSSISVLSRLVRRKKLTAEVDDFLLWFLRKVSSKMAVGTVLNPLSYPYLLLAWAEIYFESVFYSMNHSTNILCRRYISR